MIIENAPKFIGLLYAVLVIIIISILLHKEKFSFKSGFFFLLLSTLLGFLFFSPMMPISFQLLILRDTAALGSPLLMAVLGLVLILLLTFVFGRIFCGYVCPIGTIQELFSRIPIKQKKIKQKKAIMGVHLLLFVLFIALGLIFSINMLSYLGISAFFNLDLSSVFFAVFVGLLIASVFIYRPFCRFICPYGLLLSLASKKSIFALKRNNNCVDCALCEKNCPTDEAARKDFKQECYVCMRCDDVCSKNAVFYAKRKKLGE